MKKTKKINQGFTLVELIVVLVILAILAAILVPTLIGYIDKANKNTAIAEARQMAVIGKASYAEYYAHKNQTPAGNVESKNYIAGYFKDLLNTDGNMQQISTLRTTSARNGNRFAIETSPMKSSGNGAAKLIQNVKNGDLGGNCVEFYVKPTSFTSLVGLNYVSKDKNYLVTVVFDPASTTEYKDVKSGACIVQKIQ